MDHDDSQLVETLRKDGIAVMRDLLTAAEVAVVRAEYDRMHLEQGKGSGEPGVRDGVSGDAIFGYPNLTALLTHPRILAVVRGMLGEDHPWVWVFSTNRYTPEHAGVGKHTDGFLGELAPAFSRQSMAVFLDDIDEVSGALNYVPGTHRLHYVDERDPERQPPTQEDIDAGAYVPASLRAGDVILRVPEVWHGVNPIHKLRRYFTASYVSRGALSEEMGRRTAAERERRRAGTLDHVPAAFRPYYVP